MDQQTRMSRIGLPTSIAPMLPTAAKAQQQLLDDIENGLRSDHATAFTFDIADFMKSQEGVLSRDTIDEDKKAKHDVLKRLVAVMQEIIELDATFKQRLDAEGSSGVPPICVAIEAGRLDDVELLLSKGARCDVKVLEKVKVKACNAWKLEDKSEEIQLALELDRIRKLYPSESSVAECDGIFKPPEFLRPDRMPLFVVRIHVGSTNGSVAWGVFRKMQQNVGHEFESPNALVNFFLSSFRSPAIAPGNELLDYRDPGYTPYKLRLKETGKIVECAAIVFPYLTLYRQGTWNQKRADHTIKRGIKLDLQRHKIFANPTPCTIQLERTLDEAYFPGLNTRMANARNKDQVVAKEYRRFIWPGEKKAEFLPILMVPQLWFWKVGHFVVSAHSMPLSRPISTISSGIEIGHVIARAIDCFGREQEPAITGGLPLPPPLDIFETAVLSVLSAVDEYVSPDLVKKNPKDRHHGATDKIKERGFIELIADIRNELAMIQEIFEEQKEVIDEVIRRGELELLELEQSPHVNTKFVKEPWGAVEASRARLTKYEKRIAKIDKDAGRIEEIIQSKLDLHRTYASMRDAHNSLIVSMAVVGFTVVTVIFAPLAFLTALFALDIDGFSALKHTVSKEQAVANSQSTNQDDSEKPDEIYTSWKMGVIFVSSEVLTFAITGMAILIALWYLKRWEEEQNKAEMEKVLEGGEERHEEENKPAKSNDAPV